MLVNETFLSFQGEGAWAGARTFFVRMQGCNLRCSWCDTKSTWWRSSGKEYTADELFEEIQKYKVYTDDYFDICITGGEPLLQQNDKEFKKFVRMMRFAGHQITLETNGTIIPIGDIANYFSIISVSPKLLSMQDPNVRTPSISRENIEEKANFFRYFTNCIANSSTARVIFKFVVSPNKEVFEDCISEIELLLQYSIIDNRNIWLMPIGTQAVDVIAASKEVLMLVQQKRLPFSVSSRFQAIFGCR